MPTPGGYAVLLVAMVTCAILGPSLALVARPGDAGTARIDAVDTPNNLALDTGMYIFCACLHLALVSACRRRTLFAATNSGYPAPARTLSRKRGACLWPCVGVGLTHTPQRN